MYKKKLIDVSILGPIQKNKSPYLVASKDLAQPLENKLKKRLILSINPSLEAYIPLPKILTPYPLPTRSGGDKKMVYNDIGKPLNIRHATQ